MLCRHSSGRSAHRQVEKTLSSNLPTSSVHSGVQAGGYLPRFRYPIAYMYSLMRKICEANPSTVTRSCARSAPEPYWPGIDHYWCVHAALGERSVTDHHGQLQPDRPTDYDTSDACISSRDPEDTCWKSPRRAAQSVICSTAMQTPLKWRGALKSRVPIIGYQARSMTRCPKTERFSQIGHPEHLRQPPNATVPAKR